MYASHVKALYARCLFLLPFLSFSLAHPAFSQTVSPMLVYEFDKTTMLENGWTDATSGFSGQAPGTAAPITFPPGAFTSSQDQRGLAITVKPGEVAFMQTFFPLQTEGSPLLLRLTVRANAPDASVALAALRGNLNNGNGVDGSIATHIPASAASFVDQERRIVLVYEPDSGGLITPLIQVAATGKTGGVVVFVDKLEVLKLDAGEFGAAVSSSPNPTPTPSPEPAASPTPTLTPTSTPTPIPELPQTITIPLPNLPAEAKPLEMVLIKAGTFTMGCPADERGRWDNDWLPHQVTLTKDFYLGRYEITQAQYQAIMNSNPSDFSGKPNHPVEQVTWFNCATFCNRLSEREGLTPVYNESTWAANWNANGYRLPTEAEWEYACRVGTTWRYSFGDALECADEGENYCVLMDKYMWWLGNNTYGGKTDGTKEAGRKLPNPWGLYDMHGNVWEWCNDSWDSPSNRGPQVDPTVINSGSYRVLRGGSWDYDARLCRSAYRYGGNPGGWSYSVGFRIMLSRTQEVPQSPTPSPTATPIAAPTPTRNSTPTQVSTLPREITIDLPNLPAEAKPLEMVLIPAGTFMMGSPDDEQDRKEDEGPQHQVTLTKSFYMGKFKVTQGQWQAVMGSNPSLSKGLNLPVEAVSWNDCQTFIQKLNQLGQGSFRLPTEAEWEYACRAGTTTRFYWGDDSNYSQIGQFAWYGDNSNFQTHVVGLKLPNAWGLYDMRGNVFEWCQDWYGNYPSSPQVDPTGVNHGSYKVVRGGGYGVSADGCRSAFRDGFDPGIRGGYIGFRVVLSRTL